ncbi:hypothetical protein TpMuguga_03g02090 [Theileria parva strain Muguga]|uniref:uncharacterized protein n=1 Tax=Theileria parva strain Muguga TaxID=333668 RepID=UPI001C61C178|nr:uncharacterized protein TpMuguga_03g02090 [Theileria parva strain Muguga]KAF5153550.1 hypothetical protein TpMuguga_03g02090 [Theileria parva strain Muguga]
MEINILCKCVIICVLVSSVCGASFDQESSLSNDSDDSDYCDEYLPYNPVTDRPEFLEFDLNNNNSVNKVDCQVSQTNYDQCRNCKAKKGYAFNKVIRTKGSSFGFDQVIWESPDETVYVTEVTLCSNVLNRRYLVLLLSNGNFLLFGREDRGTEWVNLTSRRLNLSNFKLLTFNETINNLVELEPTKYTKAFNYLTQVYKLRSRIACYVIKLQEQVVFNYDEDPEFGAAKQILFNLETGDLTVINVENDTKKVKYNQYKWTLPETDWTTEVTGEDLTLPSTELTLPNKELTTVGTGEELNLPEVEKLRLPEANDLAPGVPGDELNLPEPEQQNQVPESAAPEPDLTPETTESTPTLSEQPKESELTSPPETSEQHVPTPETSLENVPTPVENVPTGETLSTTKGTNLVNYVRELIPQYGQSDFKSPVTLDLTSNSSDTSYKIAESNYFTYVPKTRFIFNRVVKSGKFGSPELIWQAPDHHHYSLMVHAYSTSLLTCANNVTILMVNGQTLTLCKVENDWIEFDKITLDISGNKSLDEFDYSVKNGYVTFTVKSGYFFKEIIQSNSLLLNKSIWKSEDYALKVRLNKISYDQQYIILLLKSGKFVVLNRIGDTNGWHDVTSRRLNMGLLKLYDAGGDQIYPSQYIKSLYHLSYAYFFKLGVKCFSIKLGDKLIYNHVSDQWLGFIRGIFLDLVNNKLYITDLTGERKDLDIKDMISDDKYLIKSEPKNFPTHKGPIYSAIYPM